MLRAQTGDRSAIEQLLRSTERLLRPYVESMMGDDEAASDVLQDVLLVVYRKLKSLREPRAFSAWSRRIASREVARAQRRETRRRQHQQEIVPDPEALAVEPAGSDSSGAGADAFPRGLEPLLQRVPVTSREVLILHYMEDLTLAEIAAVLDVPTGTVKSRLSYGLGVLRRLLQSSSSA